MNRAYLKKNIQSSQVHAYHMTLIKLFIISNNFEMNMYQYHITVYKLDN